MVFCAYSFLGSWDFCSGSKLSFSILLFLSQIFYLGQEERERERERERDLQCANGILFIGKVLQLGRSSGTNIMLDVDLPMK